MESGFKGWPNPAKIAAGGSLELTDGTHDLTSTTKITVSHMTVGGSSTAATLVPNTMVGDSGSGGTAGIAPAPGSGDAAAHKYLKADGTWAALPVGSASQLGAVEVDNVTITASAGVISAVGGGLPSVGTVNQFVGSDGTEGAYLTPGNFGGVHDPTTTDYDLIIRKYTTKTTVGIGTAGDSIMAGTTISTAPADTLAMDLSTAGLTVTATNSAISGTTSADWAGGGGDLTTAIASWISASVDIVLLMIGSNDAKTAVATSAADYRANVLSTCRAILSAGIPRVGLLYPPYLGATTGSFDAGSPARVLAYCQQLDTLVDNASIFLVDTTNYSEISHNTGDLQGDLLHPTQTGSDLMAARWAAGIRRILNRIVTTTWQRAALGTGLTTSGSNPITINAGSTLTTKGDLQGYSTTPARIPAASDGQGIVYDSTKPLGVRSANWATRLVMVDGSASPPRPVWTDDGTSFIYADP